MDVIPLDANLVKGSHGCFPTSVAESPVFMTGKANLIERESIAPTEVKQVILECLTNGMSRQPH